MHPQEINDINCRHVEYYRQDSLRLYEFHSNNSTVKNPIPHTPLKAINDFNSRHAKFYKQDSLALWQKPTKSLRYSIHPQAMSDLDTIQAEYTDKQVSLGLYLKATIPQLQTLYYIHAQEINNFNCLQTCQSLSSLGNSDLADVTSVGEVVITRAHIAVLPRLRDAETRRVAGGWGVVQLTLKSVLSMAVMLQFPLVTPRIEMKIQFVRIEFINTVDHFERQAGACFWFEIAASFLYPTNVGAIRAWNENESISNCISAFFFPFFLRLIFDFAMDSDLFHRGNTHYFDSCTNTILYFK